MKKDQFDIADCLINRVITFGMREVVLSPGYRNTPIVRSIYYQEEQKKIRTWVVDDERQAGFLSLGLSQSQRRPVILVCTSGSAVFHYFPAIIEAFHQSCSLIIMSADRPWTSLWCGDDQTTNQKSVFGQYAETLDIEADQGTESLEKIDIGVKNFIEKKWEVRYQPVHLNISFKKPLWKKDKRNNPQLRREGLCHFKSQKRTTVSDYLIRDLREISTLKKARGVLILGEGALNEEVSQQSYLDLINGLGCRVFADILSGSFLINHPMIYKTTEWETQIKNEKFDYVIHIGKRIIRRDLWKHLGTSQKQIWIHIGPDESSKIDIEGKVSSQMVGSIEDFLKILQEKKMIPMKSGWNFDSKKENLNEKELKRTPYKKIMQHLDNQLKKETNVFLANSLSIRLMESFANKKRKRGEIRYIGQRGVNGIDGQLSYAIGWALSEQKRMVIILGDKALYHDMNTLWLIDRYQEHIPAVMILVLNNGGGQIFNQIETNIPEKVRDKYLVSKHRYDFSFVHSFKSIDYQKIKIQEDKVFLKVFENWNEESGKIQFIELIENEENARI